MSHTYESYQVNDFHNSSIFIKVQWVEWHAMHSLVNFNDFLFTKQNLYFQSFENIWKNLSKKYFFKMIFRICKTVMVFYQFSESISGEYYVENCNLTVTVGRILRKSFCKYSWLNRFIQEHSTPNLKWNRETTKSERFLLQLESQIFPNFELAYPWYYGCFHQRTWIFKPLYG